MLSSLKLLVLFQSVGRVLGSIPFSYQVQSSYLQALDTANVIRSTASESLDTENFLNFNNYIVIPETKSVIVHSSKLDTASRVGASVFESVSNTKENRNKWYEIKQGNIRRELGPKVPLSSCLSNEFGDGGSLVGGISTTWGAVALFDVNWGLSLPFLISGELSSGLSATNFVSATGTYQCQIPQNKTGQILMQRYTQIITNGQFRELKVVEGRSWKSGFRLLPLEVEEGEWTTMPTAMIHLVDSAPIFTCVTDPEELMCPEVPENHLVLARCSQQRSCSGNF